MSLVRTAAIVAFAAGLAIAAAPAQATTVYNVVDGFNTVSPSNAVGDVWTYGTFVAPTPGNPIVSSFALLTDYAANNCAGDGPGVACWQAPVTWSRVPLVAKNISGSDPLAVFGTVLQPADVLNVHPGPGYDAVVRFTAQKAGNYKFNGAFTSLDTNPNGNGDGVLVSILNGSNVLFSGANLGVLGSSSLFSGAIALAQGETLDFVVDAKGTYWNDSTGLALDVSVPEPATWGLMIVGFGGMGAMLRRRRSMAACA